MMRDEGPAGDARLAGMLFSPESRGDPYPMYREVDVPGCRHAPASRMLRDPRLGPPAHEPADSDELLWQTFARWLLNLDGDRHERMRRRFTRIFTPRNVERYRSAIEARAHSLLDAVQDRGAMDLVVDFARPLPFSVICDILGIPEERRPWMAERMLALDTGFARRHEPEYVEHASKAVGEMLTWFGELLEERARSPRDDLMSGLAEDAPTDTEGRADLLANCVFLVEAGHVTTTGLIAGGMLLLLENPRQYEILRFDPSRVPDAVEEMLRLVSPISVVVCRAKGDVELEGYRFGSGDERLVFLPGANRDPDAFERPDDFRMDRQADRHLAFGAGAHHCLGAPLARLHGEIAIRVLTERLPAPVLAGEPVWLGSIPLREPLHLPITWRPD